MVASFMLQNHDVKENVPVSIQLRMKREIDLSKCTLIFNGDNYFKPYATICGEYQIITLQPKMCET